MLTDLFGAVLLLIMGFGLLAPLESLRWWTSKGRLSAARTQRELFDHDELAPAKDGPFLVYLSGIGVLDGSANSRKELALLDRLSVELPGATVLADVFPYSVENRGLLTGEARRTRWWTRLRRLRSKMPRLPVYYLINLRNVWQMFVSADHRYGPAYNYGVARQIWESLERAGYRRSSGSPVYLIGYSGGGQIALGAAWYLGMAGVDVSVISLGGMLSDDPGITRIRHLWHLYGTKDRIQGAGRILFAGRWPAAPLSGWNRAVKDGRITMIPIPGVIHDGRGDYFETRTSDPTPADQVIGHIVAAVSGNRAQDSQS